MRGRMAFGYPIGPQVAFVHVMMIIPQAADLCLARQVDGNRMTRG